MKYDIVDARPQDCGWMARRLRQAQREAVIRVGWNVHRELRARFDDSAFRKVWRVNGRVAALGGVTGTAAASAGIVWLAVTEEATRHPKMMVRTAREVLLSLAEVKTTLLTSVLAADPTAFRFARHLGFVLSGEPSEQFDAVLMVFNPGAPPMRLS